MKWIALILTQKSDIFKSHIRFFGGHIFKGKRLMLRTPTPSNWETIFGVGGTSYISKSDPAYISNYPMLD